MLNLLICIIFIAAIIDLCGIVYCHGRNFSKIYRYFHNILSPTPQPIKPYRQPACIYPPLNRQL